MLKDINSPAQLKALSVRELKALADEIRDKLIHTVSENGGHLASNLGIVELTLAMHYVYDCPTDKLVFDVGHQCYVHKLLTGRYARFASIRKQGGLSGFPDASESPCDCFVAGHASTAISSALGMARARDLAGEANSVVAIVGDGALTGGMCYEALNDAGQNETRMTVILNDNEMSISRNVGAMSRYLNTLRQSKGYRGFKRGVRRGLEKIPGFGMPFFRFIEKLRDAFKTLFVDGKFFEALGFVYIGPIDGHDLKHLIRVLRRAKDDLRPVLIHVVTQKGKGYRPAESRPDAFHGVAPFYMESGEARGRSAESCNGRLIARRLADLARRDPRICVVSAAMMQGTGMDLFASAFPKRFFDVGIAEEHAVSMAAGLAASGMKPYVAIYSTFMQRAYDQILNDVCRCALPVCFLLDRAGFVGEDGKTHQGIFDLSYLRSVPNLAIAAPRDLRDLDRLISLSARLDSPLAIRYPKAGVDLGEAFAAKGELRVGAWECLSDGRDVMFYACGPMVGAALNAAVELAGRDISAGVVDARFIKPMDEALLLESSARVRLAVTLEENTLCGGLGEGVARLLSSSGRGPRLMTLGAPDDFVAHGGIDWQRAQSGLTPELICARVVETLGAIDGGRA